MCLKVLEFGSCQGARIIEVNEHFLTRFGSYFETLHNVSASQLEVLVT